MKCQVESGLRLAIVGGMRPISAEQVSRPTACRGLWRHVRAAPVSLVAVALAVCGHTIGGGHAPSLILFLEVWALAAIVSWIASRRVFTIWTLTGVLVGVQVSTHVVSIFDAGPHASHADPHLSWTMLGGHALGTLVSVAVLVFGERTAWALAEALVLTPVRLLTTVGLPLPSQRDVSARIEGACAEPTIWMLSRIDPVRGPPRAADSNPYGAALRHTPVFAH